MHYSIISLFPELFEPFKTSTLISRAIENNLIELDVQNLRDFSINTQRQVDDSPYGGGGGMVLLPEVASRAVSEAKKKRPGAAVVVFSPRGMPMTQGLVRKIVTDSTSGVILLCNRYEGIDQRFVDEYVDFELSVGDAIYMGGEVPALAFLEATARLLPGVLGNDASLVEESFEIGGIEYPQYTRPRVFRGRAVPDVLLSGNHAEVDSWRAKQSEEDTALRRPDLLSKITSKVTVKVERSSGLELPPVYLCLLHYPVVDKQGKTVASSITNLDVHDIARSVKTFGLNGYYIVHPSQILRALMQKICNHWSDGAGLDYNPNRSEALSLIQLLPRLSDVSSAIEERHGVCPRIVVTSAQTGAGMLDYESFRKHLPSISQPLLIVFGTAWGIHPDVMEQADYRLQPIDGPESYNHLSVRSAVAIVLDRLFGF